MADTKISNLPASTTPLAGTETVPLVQSGVTKKVSVADLTLGRPVSANAIQFPATQVPSADPNALDDYEEGTWTPNQGAGLSVVGAFSSTGTYTKIGRLVLVSGTLTGATSIATSAGGAMCSNLPFTSVGVSAAGVMFPNSLTAYGVFAIGGLVAYATNVVSGTTISFTATYSA